MNCLSNSKSFFNFESREPLEMGLIATKNSDNFNISNSSGFCLTKFFMIFIKFCAFSKSVSAGIRDNFLFNFSSVIFLSSNTFFSAIFLSVLTISV